MDQDWTLNCGQDAEEFAPDSFLILGAIGPQTVLNSSVGRVEANTDEVIEVAIWKPFDIEIDWCTLNLQFWTADDVDFVLSYRESLERVVIFLIFASEPLGPSAWTERVGELGDREDAFVSGTSCVPFRSCWPVG